MEGESLEQAVGDLLRARGWRIAFAESCTGGLATSRMTDVAGSSDYVDRSVVVYSNEAKTDLLGVPAALVGRARRGQRAGGARRWPKACSPVRGRRSRVAITGIAGPGGGSEEKPVGTVWIGVALAEPRETRAVVCRFLGGREMVKTFAALTAIDLVRRRLIDAPWDIDWIRR